MDKDLTIMVDDRVCISTRLPRIDFNDGRIVEKRWPYLFCESSEIAVGQRVPRFDACRRPQWPVLIEAPSGGLVCGNKSG